jgi:hypothetical protein
VVELLPLKEYNKYTRTARVLYLPCVRGTRVMRRSVGYLFHSLTSTYIRLWVLLGFVAKHIMSQFPHTFSPHTLARSHDIELYKYDSQLNEVRFEQ